MDDLTTKPVRLSDATLNRIPNGILKPTYDRSRLSPGIVHIGLGNFHRGHQAWYLHSLMQKGLAHDWAIVGAGVRPYDEAMRQKLAGQDYLTTLIELDPLNSGAEVIGSMIDYVPIEEGNGPLIAQMADPSIRIVAMTVTEGGYYLDTATGNFDAEHADIQHDAAKPNTPITAFGAIISALRLRRDAGTGPFTLQSCDNLQGNGDILRQTVVSLAKMSDPEFADWINAECSFPNSMVDCIVPATGAQEIALARNLGIEDAAPVTHETFRQWVIEDDFCAGRPEWDMVGATFSDRVHDFETMKIRILNGGHQLIANVGELLSIETIAETMSNTKISDFFLRVASEEIVPHVHDVPGMAPLDYVDLINRRFSNPKIVDTVRRVAFDGSSRHPGFLLPTIRDAIERGTPIDGLALAEAFWARMCTGERDDGSVIEPNDPIWGDLNAAALKTKSDPLAWLAQKHIYGDIGENERFAEAFEQWLNVLWSDGAEAALSDYLA